MADCLMRRLAVVTDEGVELDAYSGKSKLLARPTICANAVACEASQLFHFLFRFFRHCKVTLSVWTTEMTRRLVA